MAKKITAFEILVYIAYGFYILLGATWFVISFIDWRNFNYQAFSLVAIFSAQAYFRHRLTNLILGILSLFFSIFMVLSVIDTFNLMAPNATYDALTKALLALSLCSMGMSIILMFSYTKLSFKPQ